MIGEEFPHKPPGRPREKTFVSGLALVKVDRLGAGAPVNVAEYMETRLDAPDLTQEMGTAESEVEVVLRRAVRNEYVGLGMHSAEPRMVGVVVLETAESRGLDAADLRKCF